MKSRAETRMPTCAPSADHARRPFPRVTKWWMCRSPTASSLSRLRSTASSVRAAISFFRQPRVEADVVERAVEPSDVVVQVVDFAIEGPRGLECRVSNG